MATAPAHHRTRHMVLIFGPFAIIGCCFWLTRPPALSHETSAWQNHPSTLAASPVSSGWWQPLSSLLNRDRNAEKLDNDTPSQEEITKDVQEAANQLRMELGTDFQILARAPFVLASDSTMEDLQWMYANVLLPSQHALSISYFDSPVNKPIKIILVKSAARWNSLRPRWPGFRPVEYAGFYSRDDHCIAINLETGIGSLAHELTHALIHSDFENCPEWFDEGLASLHEECEFNETATALKGLPNWRYQHFREALHRSQAPALKILISQPFATSNAPAIEYAHSRLFCIYLQQQGVLESFYRRLRRSTAAKDSAIILCQLTKTVDLDQLNSQFIDWARTQTQASETALQEHHETLPKSDDVVSDSTTSPRVQTKQVPEPASSFNLAID
ncbi:hypothetical protein Spb1_30070 [Planctopirus ephydatiae]|uniref:DUF1570 domain-containing protein n=2 Tax=Planctopirus ephydatiae TaxID=2528019 RepID=A0A518GR58_9PLAN|nr:hypothetical protein Spb1_30070 [Planctopirus ephydatiae]